MSALSQWTTFYEIVGCSGGALVGLQFVVIALIANSRLRTDFQAVNAFGTPNVLHFSAALTISAIMSAPWTSLFATSLAIGICGIIGLGYSATVFYRASHQTAYKPVFEAGSAETQSQRIPITSYAAFTTLSQPCSPACPTSNPDNGSC